MSNIYKSFKNKKALIGHLIAGTCDFETAKNCIINAEKAGASLFIITIPFSDPIAQSDIIQYSNLKALKNGITVNDIFDMVKLIRKETQIPLVFLTYINPVFNYGYEKFFKECQNSGIEGIIVYDVPLEEKEEIDETAEKYNVDVIRFLSPYSIERAEKIAENSKDFAILPVSSDIDCKPFLTSLKEKVSVPIVILSENNSKEKIKYFSEISDGIIIESRLIKIIDMYENKSSEYVYNYVKELAEIVN